MFSGVRERRALCNLARELIRGQAEYTLNRQALEGEESFSELQVQRLFSSDSELRLAIAEAELYSYFKHLEYAFGLHRQPAKVLLFHACWLVYETNVMERFPLVKLVPSEKLVFSVGLECSRRYLRVQSTYDDYLLNLLKQVVSPKSAGVYRLYKAMVNGHCLGGENEAFRYQAYYRTLISGLSDMLGLDEEVRPSLVEQEQWFVSKFSVPKAYESLLATAR
ncbi:hypothetical protein [Ferrimonas sp.]|uniref:hypothetical protein n=1 Tax=Ferrimonas sp. TaxID=2080861 RepID=UPI003A9135D2